MAKNRFGARRLFRPKRFLITHGIFFDQRIGGFDDFRRRAVIFQKQKRFRIGISFIEIEKEFYVRAAPRIDRLIGIADDVEIPVLCGKCLCDFVLLFAYVLKFVDHDVLHACLPFFAHGGKMFEDIRRKIY